MGKSVNLRALGISLLFLGFIGYSSAYPTTKRENPIRNRNRNLRDLVEAQLTPVSRHQRYSRERDGQMPPERSRTPVGGYFYMPQQRQDEHEQLGQGIFNQFNPYPQQQDMMGQMPQIPGMEFFQNFQGPQSQMGPFPSSQMPEPAFLPPSEKYPFFRFLETVIRGLRIIFRLSSNYQERPEGQEGYTEMEGGTYEDSDSGWADFDAGSIDYDSGGSDWTSGWSSEPESAPNY